MSSGKSEATETAADAAQQLLEILENNPGIFRDNPALLEFVEIPDPQDAGVASLFEKQAQVLRERISRLNLSSSEMVAAARENELVSERLFDVTCELLSASDLESLLEALYSNLKEKFDIERVTLRVSGRSLTPGIAEIDPSHGMSDAYHETLAMIRRHSHCDERLPTMVLQYLFGDTSTEIGSVALIPLMTSSRGGEPVGVLALGSSSRKQFKPGLGTTHLDRLGTIIGIVIQRYFEH